ncbi:MAG: hypothetical protein OEU95_05505 [Nitrospirota bacterium]|nr:hypothetical protein [Nitrospirota bacterium]
MSFWNKIQSDLKESLSFFKEGSTLVTDKIEKLADEGRKKFTVFNLNMKVQEEFARLGGQIYDLIGKKSKDPLANKTVTSIIDTINKLETQISKLENSGRKKVKKTASKKTRGRTKGKHKPSSATAGKGGKS